MSSKAQNKLSWQWLALISVLLLFSGIGLLSLYALDEARNAGAAREMYLNEEYIVPTFNGELRTHKPPLHYFFMNLGYRIFGLNPFGARFFSALMGVVTLGLIYWFANKIWHQKVAVSASLVVLSSVHFLLQMQMAVPDPYLIVLLTTSFFSFYLLWKTGERKYWWLFYIAIGFGILAKGPIAIALPGLAGLLFLIFSKSFNWKTIIKMNPFIGLALSILIALPWFYLVHLKTDGAFTEGFFFEHNINRYSESFEGHNGSPLLTLAFVLLGFLPFVFFLPSAILTAWKEKNNRFIYLFCVVIAVVGFFMTSGTKLPNYTVPAYPALALILGYYFSEHKGKRWQWMATLLWCCLITVAGFFAFQFDDSLQLLKWYSLFFIIPVIGAVIALTYPNKSFISYSSSWMVFALVFFTLIYPAVDRENPVRKTMNKINQDSKIVGYKIFNPAFVFALDREIPQVNTIDELELLLNDSQHITVISRKQYIDELQSIEQLSVIAEAKDILETPTTIILEKK